jgi:hypothetical protein
MPLRLSRFQSAALLPVLFLAGCTREGVSTRAEYDMGERVPIGPLTYNVVDSVWRSQLGDEFNVRLPQGRFLLISISVTNGGGHDLSVPLLMLEGEDGKQYKELESGDGVDSWFGLLRTINPAQTQQGRLLFDVPLASYRLRLTDGGEAGSERFAWVKIPLRIDPETDANPLPEPSPPGK